MIDSKSENKSAVENYIKILFPQKKDIEFVLNKNAFNMDDPSYRGGYSNGRLLLNDMSGISTQSKTGDTVIIDGLSCKYQYTGFIAKGDTSVYESPSYSSRRLQGIKLFINSSDVTKLGKKIVMKKNSDVTIPVIKGSRIVSYASYVSPRTAEGTWYFVQTDYHTYGWINGNNLESRNANAKEDEYIAAFYDRLAKDGYLKFENMDSFSIPNGLHYFAIDEEGESCLFYNDEKVWMFTYNKSIELPASTMKVDEDGFLKFKYKSAKMLFIFGGIEQVFSKFQNDGENEYVSADEDGGYHNYNIKSIKTSSYFKEKIKGRWIEYTGDNLGKAFQVGCRCHPYWWNYKHIPWVEGVDGNGIGETITVEFTEKMVGMNLLNGYTDINNLKLYKENARVKQMKLEDLDNNTESTIDFDDYVYFEKVIFEKPTSKIRLTIQDVYEGTKYQDTCFSAILPIKEFSDFDKETWIRNEFEKCYKGTVEVTPEDFLEIE